MRARVGLLLAIFLSALASPAAAQTPGETILTPEEQAFLQAHGPLRVAANPYFPPFVVYERGEPRGINVDVLRLISVKTGIEFTLVEASNLSDSLEMMREGAADVVGVSATPERHRYMDFTEAYAVAGSTFWVRDGEFASADQLAGARVLAPRGSATLGQAREAYPEIEFVPVDDPETALTLVSNGTYAAYLAPTPTAAFKAHRLGLRELAPLPSSLAPQEFRFGVREGNEMLLSIMQKGLDAIDRQERAAIFVKWTGYDLSPPARRTPFEMPGWILPSVGGVGALALAAGAYATLLRTQVRARTRELSRSNRLLGGVIEGTTDAVFVKDADGRYLLINQAGARFMGRPEREILGRTDRELLGAAGGAMAEAERGVREAGEVRTYEETLDLGGARRTFLATKGPYRGEGGEVEGIIGISRDITERKEMEEALRRAKAAAEAAGEAKATFLANMSHEIRTPLNAVIGMTTLLSMTRLDDEQREEVETIRRSGEHLLTVINDVLDVSKIESGNLRLERAPFDPRDVVEEALDLVSARAVEKDLEVVASVDPSVPRTLEGDAGRLRQVLVNLLSNAVKFTDRGEVVVGVSSAPAEEGMAELRVEVRDTGIGIPSEQAARLFQPFTQADDGMTRARGGTGLGLVITKRLVEAMGGSVWLESQPHRGSTFGFTMRSPVARLAAPDEDAVRLAGRRVLVAEPNAAARDALAARLASWGAVPIATGSAHEAMQAVRAPRRLDAVLVTHGAFGLDAAAFARDARRARGDAFPVLALAQKGWRRDGLAA